MAPEGQSRQEGGAVTLPVTVSLREDDGVQHGHLLRSGDDTEPLLYTHPTLLGLPGITGHLEAEVGGRAAHGSHGVEAAGAGTDTWAGVTCKVRGSQWSDLMPHTLGRARDTEEFIKSAQPIFLCSGKQRFV